LPGAPTAVGVYYLGVSAAEGQYYNAVTEVKERFEIIPATLLYTEDDIVTSDKTFTGNLLTWTTGDITAFPDYTTLTSVTGAWTDAGDYNIVVRLTADSNHTFSGTAGDYYDFEVPVSILQAVNSWTAELSCADVIYGGSPAPEAAAAFGNVVITYSNELEGVYTETMPSNNVGTYYVKATVTGNSNYTGLENTITFAVIPMTISYTATDILTVAKIYTGAALSWTPEEFTAPLYTAINLVTIIEGQNYTDAGNPTITVVLKADSNYTFGTAAGDTASFTVTLTINKADASIVIVTDSVLYDGLAIEGTDFDIEYEGDGALIYTWYSNNAGERGEEISAPVNTGVYWIGISAAEGNNYNAAAIAYRMFELLPAENSWTEALTITGWTYGGTPVEPHAAAQYYAGGEPVYSYILIDD
jgi:hypothetical protein